MNTPPNPEPCMLCLVLHCEGPDFYVCNQCGKPLDVISEQNWAIDKIADKLLKVIEAGPGPGRSSSRKIQQIIDWIGEHRD